MRRAAALLVGALLGQGALAGCAPSPPRPAMNQSASPAAGTVVGTSDLAADALGRPTALAKRITYVSRSGVNDGPTQVTAAVFEPAGNPPPGGWRIVVYGHSSVGVRAECAPSLSPDLRGGAATVAGLLDAGYVVAAPDYQGLGGPADGQTYHPYLDSTSVGYNMIDAVRAVRALIPDASTRWAALGVEQGGQAAWAANELAANQGWGLVLVGSASLSPIADIDALANPAGSLSRDQQLLLAAYLDSLHREFPDDFPLNDYRRGAAAQNWDALLACTEPAQAERGHIAASLAPDDVGPTDAAAAARLRGFLKKTNLPQGSAKAPMLVMYGGDDPLVPAPWTAGALERACRMGDIVSITAAPDATRITPDLAFGWIADRFNDIAAHNDCDHPSSTAAG